MKNINLTVGDWSDDGHGKTDQFTVKCSHKEIDLRDCHKKFKEKYKLNFSNECRDYENNKLSSKMIDLLKSLEIIDDNFFEDDDDRYINPDQFADLYMKICVHINPDIKYKFAKYSSNINIGGYGLFE